MSVIWYIRYYNNKIWIM